LESFESQELQQGYEMAFVLEEMADWAAHKLKNPLAGMMLGLTRLENVLKDPNGLEKAIEITKDLCTLVSAFSKTVDNVVNATGKPKLEYKQVNINDILKSALSRISERATAGDIEVHRELSADLPPVTADSQALKGALINLMVDAIEAMLPSGSLSIQTKVKDNDQVEVLIQDARPNVDIARQELLLNNPFSLGNVKAADLRLCAARRIVELHSGTIALHSRSNGGIETAVSFPVAT
jgi:K+-sensing histidine kinase KdpD